MNLLFIARVLANFLIMDSLAEAFDNFYIVTIENSRKRFEYTLKRCRNRDNISIFYLNNNIFIFSLQLLKLTLSGKIKFDIILTQNISNGLFSSIPLKILFRKKIISFMCNMNIKYKYFTLLKEKKKCIRLRILLLKNALRLNLMFSDKVIVLSEALKKELIDLGYSNKKITKIPFYGVNIKIMNQNKGDFRKKFGFSKKDKIICIVARLSPEKGIKYLLDAFLTCSRSIKDLKLLIVGSGPEQNELREFIKTNRIQSNVLHILKSEYWDLPEIYRTADIYFQPSLSEGLGFTPLEAMACGTPVITTGVDGMKDYSFNENTTLVVKPKNVGQYSNAIIRILNDAKLRKKLIQNGKKIVRKRYDHEKLERDFIKEIKITGNI